MMSNRILGAACLSAVLVMPFGVVGTARADSQTTIEKRTTTTNTSGNIVIENESNRTFKLEGHTETYTAPPDFDLPTYRGKEVTVYTDPDGKVTRIERKTVTEP